MLMRSFAVAVAVVCVILGAMFWHVPAASAQTAYVDVPAAGFPLGANTTYLDSFGAVQGDGADVVRAAVRLEPGFRICQVKFWAHDNDTNNVAVRLVRKNTAVSGQFGSAPDVIASVSSAGASDLLRAFSTSTVTAPVISAAFFYWVELDFEGGPIQVTGVRIRTSPAC